MFGFHEDAYAQVFGGKTHQSSWTHELIAGAAAFEAAKAYEKKNGGPSFLGAEHNTTHPKLSLA